MPARRVQVRGSRYAPVCPVGAIYIGRPAPYLRGSLFANQHPVGRCCPRCGFEHDRVSAVAAHARDLDAAPELVQLARRDLVGAELACRCSLDPADGPCHGDVLALVAGGVDPLAAELAGRHVRAGRRELADQVVDTSRALSGVAGPSVPTDGDCHVWGPQVTEALQAGGHPATAATVFGWLDPAMRVLVFVHEATLIGDLVIDFSAGQYRTTSPLPRRWFAGVDDYCGELASATGCGKVTVQPGAD